MKPRHFCLCICECTNEALPDSHYCKGCREEMIRAKVLTDTVE